MKPAVELGVITSGNGMYWHNLSHLKNDLEKAKICFFDKQIPTFFFNVIGTKNGCG